MAVRGRLIVNGRRSGAVQLSVSIQFVAAGALQSDAVAIRFSWRAPHTAATAEFDGQFPRRSSGPHPLRQSAVQSQPSVEPNDCRIKTRQTQTSGLQSDTQ